MADAFTLSVPVASLFRDLVPEIASRYAELSGGSPDDGSALAASVGAALDRIAGGVESGALVALSFRPESGGVHVDLSCNGRRETVDVTMPVAKR